MRETVEVRVPVYETVPVPETLLEECTVSLPVHATWTNADIERLLAEALIELKRCSADKAAIRNLE